MKMQIYKLCFILALAIIFSTLVSAGNIVYQDGEIILEGEFDINGSENSTTFTSEGFSVTFDDPIEEIPLDEESSEKMGISYIGKKEVLQDESEINSEDNPSQKSSVPITGAVIGSKSKNYIVPVLVILIVIVGIVVGLLIWKKK